MNYTQQVHGERSQYVVPPGLTELMTDISREVLRDQPDNIYEYIADYLDTLLRLRTNTQQALEVVDDVLAENQELFAYVEARGMTWEEANKEARVIQRAYRRARARRELKERVRKDKEDKLAMMPIAEHSPSFIEYFESLGIDYERANKASITIQMAFKTYMSKKELGEMSKCSTHTIDLISPPVEGQSPLVLDKLTARDSRLLVYKQSPLPSINSGWYKPLDYADEKRSVASATSSGLVQKLSLTRDSKLLVYQQSPKPSIDSAWYGADYLAYRRSTDVSLEAERLGLTKGLSFLDRESAPAVEARVPSYFDKDRAKVPMVTESGQLDVVPEDVVTLFSTDTVKVSRVVVAASPSSFSNKESKQPSLKDLGKKSSRTDSETAKELFSIIDKKVEGKEEAGAGSKISLAKAETGSAEARASLLSRSILMGSRDNSEDGRAVLTRPSESSQKTEGSIRPRSSSRMLKMNVKESVDEEYD